MKLFSFCKDRLWVKVMAALSVVLVAVVGIIITSVLYKANLLISPLVGRQ